MQRITIDHRTQINVEGPRKELLIRFSASNQVVTEEQLRQLISVPAMKDALAEAAQVKNRRGTSSASPESDAKDLMDAHRNLFSSPKRGLLGIPEEILEAITENTVHLYQLTANVLEECDLFARIDFDALCELRAQKDNELSLKGGASLHKLALIPGMGKFGTYGYYKPNESLFLLIPAEIIERARKTLDTHRPTQHAPRAERPQVGRPARGRDR